jgi:hypothetical protein
MCIPWDSAAALDLLHNGRELHLEGRTFESLRVWRHHSPIRSVMVETMAVRIRLKGDREREVEYPDTETDYYTAQGILDGRVEVTRSRRGSSEPRVAVHQFDQDQIESIVDSGWPSDDGPLD